MAVVFIYVNYQYEKDYNETQKELEEELKQAEKELEESLQLLKKLY
jgi:hypothetical protein